MESASSVCPGCSLPVLSEFYFCPNCGKVLRPKPLTVSLGRQIGVYVLSFFLPPLGLYPAFKYIKQSDPKTKLIGWIAVILTIVSIFLSLYILAGFMQQFSKTLEHELEFGTIPGQLTEVSRLSEEYAEESFWEELCETLGERDFEEKYAPEEIEEMDRAERDEKLDECTLLYEEETERYGIDRLHILKQARDFGIEI